MKKKIGIATITFTKEESVDFNYGNILQNYALSTYLKKQGYSVDTIYYTSSYYEELTSLISHKYQFEIKQFADDIVRIYKRKLYWNVLQGKREVRKNKFNLFIEENIKYSVDKYNIKSNLKELDTLYDAFITGSDQVWNPYYEGSNEFYYLYFAKKGKRISYAPSIAVDAIPELIREKYAEWISNIDYLSIREKSGQILLKNLYGFEAKIVCDPVFLLDKKQWSQISVDVNINKKYFLIYILGKKTVSIKKNICMLEKRYNIKGIDVYSKDEIESMFAGPKEFLGLIKNAEFVFTNSFHGAALSTIFEKSIVISDRVGGERMNSRIDDLLALIDAPNREIQYILKNPNLIEMKFNNKNKLDMLINDSKEFLNNALL
ncbi:polysaccharide pyruvyl transferase family protein [Anaerocolumna sp. MB42-C2]|uniref:polysaccharide pyruvyl transferase family protein n=1 Tax=Anaerocolumna sp. MB42-C2 TaxID=3070997 RepID=UPI0027E1B43B|nr:polysaccharide pyruvyl transferase family protein [Anaerocolumna sp. MB42-C2]WMJ85818.1 polysaccharide pyruvyl transferase family protein [Anaerocolumna sp. MB42-C2]